MRFYIAERDGEEQRVQAWIPETDDEEILCSSFFQGDRCNRVCTKVPVKDAAA